MLPTTSQRATHDYERNETCDLFAALNTATGSVITDIRKSHTSADFIAFLNKVNREVPKDLGLVGGEVVEDDVHGPPPCSLAPAPPPVPLPLHPHLRVVDEHGGAVVLGADDQEGATLGPPQREGARRRHRGVGGQLDENPTPFVWHKTAEQILERIAGYCAAVNEATRA